MNIVFCVDIDEQIGIGHFSRCLSVAALLKKRQHNVCFIMPYENLYVLEKLSNIGIRLAVKDGNTQNQVFIIKQDRSSSSLDTECDLVIECVKQLTCDWLIVDSYRLDCSWQTRLRPLVNNIAIIDDLANRCHECDLLVDQNYYDEGDPYKNLVPAGCVRLLGPKYVLLSADYEKHKWTKPPGKYLSVVVFFGGSDEKNYTSRFLSVLRSYSLQSIDTIWVIVGPLNKNKPEIIELSNQIAKSKVVLAPESLNKYFSEASISIGAIGVSTWEKFFCRCLAILIPTSQNQFQAAKTFADKELAIVCNDVQPAVQAMVDVANDNWDSNKIIDRAESAVDGVGAERLVEALETW